MIQRISIRLLTYKKRHMSKVILKHPILGKREFDADHASRILALDKSGGWEMEKQTVKDAAGTKRSKTKAKGTGKEASDS